MIDYDENLYENAFLQALRTDYCSILHQAVKEEWLICVPRNATITASALSQVDIKKHILVPSLVQNCYTTLTDQQIVQKENYLILNPNHQDKMNCNCDNVYILFSETIYDQFGKYKLLCLENPLFCNKPSEKLYRLTSVHDAINFLTRHVNGNGILGKIDIFTADACILCCSVNTLSGLQQIFLDAYDKSYKLLELHRKIGRKENVCNIYYRNNVFTTIEMYVHHKLYNNLIESLSLLLLDKDSFLNTNLQNASNIANNDLDIVTGDYLAKAQDIFITALSQSTVLEKIKCFKKCIDYITEERGYLSTDNLLPLIVLFLIRSEYPKWHVQLAFLKNFHSNEVNLDESSAESFIITTLEAAIQFIEAGGVFCSQQHSLESSKDDFGCYFLRSEMNLIGSCAYNLHLTGYFDKIKQGKYAETDHFLQHVTNKLDATLQGPACHPLCSCEICRKRQDIQLSECRDDFGRTSLHIACALGCPKLVMKLLGLGATVIAVDEEGKTALHYAAMKGNKNCLLLLLHASVPLDVADKDGNTALHFAAKNGHTGCLKGLLFYSELHRFIDCNKQNANGDTPIHLACKYGYKESVIALMDLFRDDMRCDLQILNKCGQAASDCCYNNDLKLLVINTMSIMKSKMIDKYENDFRYPSTSSSFKMSHSDNSVNVTPPNTKDTKESVLQHTHTIIASSSRSSETGKVAIVSQIINKRSKSFHLVSELTSHDAEKRSAVMSLMCHPLCQCSNCAVLVASPKPASEN